jgi:hypothetical protein
MNTLMLVCAIFAALASGVLLGYGCCKGLFAALGLHARSIAPERASAKAQVATSL